MRLTLSAVALSLSLSALACSSGGDPAVDPASPDEASEDALRGAVGVQLTDEDEGKTVSVEKGKSVRVTLSSNATTGYKWKVTSTDRSFGYPSPRDGTYKSASSGRVGSGGQQVFEWKTNGPVLAPGDAVHAVTLEYRRSFESDDVPAARTFSFRVKIRAVGEEEQAEPQRVCPASHTINCMPPTTNPSCKSDFRSWAQANCDVSYLD